VKNYLFRIFDKLGVSKRVEVVLYAYSLGATNGKSAATASPKKLPIGQIGEGSTSRLTSSPAASEPSLPRSR